MPSMETLQRIVLVLLVITALAQVLRALEAQTLSQIVSQQ